MSRVSSKKTPQMNLPLHKDSSHLYEIAPEIKKIYGSKVQPRRAHEGPEGEK
jgi:hypothetical protein